MTDSYKRTRVVNIRLDDYDVYIGRTGKGITDAPFGNPFSVKQADYRHCKTQKEALRLCLADYKEWFLKRVNSDKEFRCKALALKGKRLGCFCAPKGGLTATDTPWVCHGQVIAAWLECRFMDG